MISLRNVTRSYGDKVAVNALDLGIAPGELFALLGHNGAGKTTTIKMLVGLLRPQSGVVEIDGLDAVVHSRQSARSIGYVPDQPFLYEKLSGREFLTFVAQMHGLANDEVTTAIETEIERFGLGRFVDDLTESYSHGMKQRTVFASAILHNPNVIVVDEPLVGLDPHSIRLVKDLLRSKADEGKCVFMSTHTLSAAEELADRIGVMHRGRLLFLGTVDELRAERSAHGVPLESLYLSLLDNAEGEA